jgi:N-acetylglucosaminyldiphosphoundecaprenol N-acetyl-beta-D-mannosaminyltransferase
MKRHTLFGVNVNPLSWAEISIEIENILQQNQLSYLVTLNPEIFLKTLSSPSYRDVINRARVVTVDGVGIQAAADFIDQPIANRPIIRELMFLIETIKVGLKVAGIGRFRLIPEKITGADLVMKLFEQAQVKGWRVFILGGTFKSLDLAVKKINLDFPQINIVGYQDGGRIDDLGRGENDENLVNVINESRADILLVCFGAPKQEYWINNQLNNLSKVRLAMCLGGSVDYISGDQKRAPYLFRKISLEWLWRLINQPWRLGRIIKAIIVFPLYIAQNKYSMVKSTHD